MRHKLRLVLGSLFITLLPFSLAYAQSPQTSHERIRKALESNDLQTAIGELRSLRSSDPSAFAANNYDYLLGRLAERLGDAAGSQASYESTAARKSPLASHATWHLAQLARASGDLVLERERLRQFLIGAAPSPLREAAILRLGESFWESGDYGSIPSALRPLTSSKNVGTAREAMAITGQALLRTNKTQEARDLFMTILMQMPDASRPDDFALTAARELDALDPEQTNVSEQEHLLRASVYQFNRDFDAARRHYQAIVTKFPQNPTVPNALYQIGRGFYSQQNYELALKNFYRVTNEFPESSSARDALSFTAGSYNRMKRTDDAIAAYKRFIVQFPDSPNPERTYLNIIDALHEAERYKEALQWALQTRARFNGQLGATLALFAQARIHLAQGSWSAVVADTEELKKAADLGGTRVPSGTTLAEVSFLQALALELQGKIGEATEQYLSIPDGRNEYYGQRATDRLQAFAGSTEHRELISRREQSLRTQAKQALDQGQHDQARRLGASALRLATDATRKESLEILRRAYQSLPAYVLPNLNLIPLGRQEVVANDSAATTPERSAADELLFLGLYDEAVPAFTAAASTDNKTNAAPQQSKAAPSDSEYTLAVLALRGGLANHAVRFGERLWRSVPQDYVLDLAPRQLVDLLYPIPHRDSLLKHAPARGLDPRFLLSIARQESRFQADVKSVAAARGMMQFIPATASDVAKQLGKSDFQQDQLYNPDTAVLFGSQYLASLFREFPAAPEAVAAAYNSGSDNVARWMARSRSNSPDRYVPEIGFAQTKDYVFRVMTNFRAYQQLYDSQLQRQ